VLLEVAPAVKAKELQNASAVTVTLIPSLIVTSSDEVGISCPPQVAVLFQFPLADAVFGSAYESEVVSRQEKMINKKNVRCFKYLSSNC
jgi:hypothetical protein